MKRLYPALFTLLCLATPVLVAPTPALAQDGRDRSIIILNRSSEAIHYVRGSNTSQSRLGRDRLGSEVVMPGNHIMVDFDDGTGACWFDLQVELGSGTTANRSDVNVCAVAGWVIYDRSNELIE